MYENNTSFYLQTLQDWSDGWPSPLQLAHCVRDCDASDAGDVKEEESIFAFSTSAFMKGIFRNEEENSGLRAILVASE